MNSEPKPKTRYAYIDNIKFAACILVVAGHFFMSMTANGIMPYSNAYDYLLQTVYTFHVPVFFVCSGFLYQKSDRVHGVKSWSKNVLQKLLDLGVPYAVFTTVTVLLKHLFENDVTSKSGDLLETLFVFPTAPYWYLYALFFLFVLIPCMRSKKHAVLLLGFSVALKVAIILLNAHDLNPEQLVYRATGSKLLYIPVHILLYAGSRLVWFAIGIFMAFVREDAVRKHSRYMAPLLLAGAVALSLFTFQAPDGYKPLPQFAVGVLFVGFILYAAVGFAPARFSRLTARTASFFMPVYVMHTICSAGIRIALMKAGVTNLPLHILGGCIGGFLIPAAAYLICQKLTPLMFVFYPTKTVKILRQKTGKSRKTDEAIL